MESTFAHLAAGFEAALLRPLFEPIERACGPFGDLAARAWTEHAGADRDDAFIDMLRRSLEPNGLEVRHG